MLIDLDYYVQLKSMILKSGEEGKLQYLRMYNWIWDKQSIYLKDYVLGSMICLIQIVKI